MPAYPGALQALCGAVEAYHGALQDHPESYVSLDMLFYYFIHRIHSETLFMKT